MADELMSVDENPFEPAREPASEPVSSPAAQQIGEQWAEESAALDEGFQVDPEPEPDPEAEREAYVPALSPEDKQLADQARARWREEQAEQVAEETLLEYDGLMQDVLDNAVARFEYGEEHPAAILAELQANPGVAPEVAEAFHAMWAAADEGIDLADPDTYPIPETAEEYAEAAWAVYAQQQAAMEQQQAEAQQAAWDEHWSGLMQAAPGVAQETIASMSRVDPALFDVAVASQFAHGLIPSTPEQIVESIQGAVRVAGELGRVQRHAEVKADLAEHNSLWQGFLPDGPQPAFDREGYLGAEMEAAVDPRRVAPPPSSAERAAATRATLEPDARERALAEAFDVRPSPAEIERDKAPRIGGRAVGYRRGKR